jgi:hypothetical protein
MDGLAPHAMIVIVFIILQVIVMFTVMLQRLVAAMDLAQVKAHVCVMTVGQGRIARGA